jgi:hypothetical protein
MPPPNSTHVSHVGSGMPLCTFAPALLKISHSHLTTPVPSLSSTQSQAPRSQAASSELLPGLTLLAEFDEAFDSAFERTP